MIEIRLKGCECSTRTNRSVTSKYEAKPNYETHNYCFPVEDKTASNFHLPFTFAHTQMEHFLWMRQWACVLTLSEHVCESEWQRGVCVHMHAQLFSLACHHSEIDGEKFPTRRKTCLTFFKTRVENIQLALKAILTSLGRGSWACAWTWALGCRLVGPCWLLNGSSISPPDWWALLRERRWVSVTHLQFQREQ